MVRASVVSATIPRTGHVGRPAQAVHSREAAPDRQSSNGRIRSFSRRSISAWSR